MRYLMFVVFLIWGNQPVGYSQNTLSGYITNQNSEPLAGAHIHISQSFSLSEPDGSYSVNVADGRHLLRISYVGYKSVDTLVALSNDVSLNFRLVFDTSQLDEVVITDKSIESNASLNSQVLRTKTIEQYSGKAIGDLLQEISGVSALKSGNAVVKPIIHGLHSNRVLLINNNVRLEDHQWGLEHAPNFDINTAGKVTVIKGASGLQYGGDAIGGVVVIEPSKVAVMDTLFGKTIANGASNGRGGSISTSLYKGYDTGWNWNLQGTIKHLGDFEAPDYILSNTGTREKNFSGGVTFEGLDYGFGATYSYFNAEIGILSASHIGNITDLVSAINGSQPSVINDFTYEINAPKQMVQHHLVKANYYKTLDALGRLDLQYALQFNNRLEYDIRRGSDDNRASLDLDLRTQMVSANFETLKSESAVYKFGLMSSYQTNAASIETGVRPLIPDYVKIDAGAYAIATFRISPKLDLESGFRYDFSRISATKFYLKSRWQALGYDADFSDIIIGDFATQWKTRPEFTYHNISASAGIKFKPTQNLSWFTNLSLSARNPNPAELFSDGLHHASGQIELGDLRLKQEKAFKASTGLSYKRGNLTFEFEPYVNVISDFIVLNPIGLEQSIRGAFPVFEYDQVNALLVGADVTASYRINEALQYRTSASYIAGTDTASNRPLIEMPPINWDNSFHYERKSWSGFTFALKSEIMLYQDRFPDNDFIADVIINGAPQSTVVNISRPPPGYHLLNAYSSVDLNIFKKSKVTLALNVENVFDTNYRNYLNRTRFYADDLGRNVTFQIKYNY